MLPRHHTRLEQKVTLARLSTTVEQEQSRNEHLNQLRTKIDADEERRVTLTKQLQQARAEKNRDFQLHDDLIAKFKGSWLAS